MGREDEVFCAVGGLECVVRQGEPGDRHSHLALADCQFRVGVQREVVAARRERQARRAPPPGIEVRAFELVVGGEAGAGDRRRVRLALDHWARSRPWAAHARVPAVE